MIAWIVTNYVYLLTIALAVSEIMGSSSRFKNNSIFQLVLSCLKSLCAWVARAKTE